MFAKKFYVPLALLALALLMAVVCSAQVMELTIWPLPGENSQPQQIHAVAKQALPVYLRIYFAEFGVNRVAELQPATNKLREWEVGEGPVGIYAREAYVGGQYSWEVYCTLARGNAVAMVNADTNTSCRWPIPTANSWPKGLEAKVWDPVSGLYFPQRNVGQVARLWPEESEATCDTRVPTTWDVVPDVMRIDPVVHHVEPWYFAGAPPMTGHMPGVQHGVITEWTSPEIGTYIEQVAARSDELWFVDGVPHILVLRVADNPADSTCDRYELPSGIVPGAIAVDVDVWFAGASTSSPVIGRLDSTTGEVSLWNIPGAVQPFDLVVDRSAQSPEGEHYSKVWFTDRGAEAIGYLDVIRNEIVLYPLPRNTFPLYLTKVMDEVWFTTDRGNLVGRLKVFNLSTWGELPESTGCTFWEYSWAGAGSYGSLGASFTYDGSRGLPVWVGMEVLNQGVPVPGFVVSQTELEVRGGTTVNSYPPNMSSAGNAKVRFIFEYEGTDRVQSDMVRIYLSDQPEGMPFCYNNIEMIATWIPKP